MAEAMTFVTDEMREEQGVWGDERSSYPISESDIRKWAIATFWPETPPKIYWDAEYAAKTKWRGIIAPRDFNPFAWTVRVKSSEPRQPAFVGPKHPEGRPLTGMNGGQTDTHGVMMRPGDVITSRSRLKDWEEREGRLGHTIYVRTETEWRNQNDEFVRTRISTGIRY